MIDIKFQSPVFFCAGEASGDVYAGFLAEKLKGQLPNVRILGVGGGNMRGSGVEIVSGYEQLSTFGLTDTLSSLASNYSCYRKIVRELLESESRTFIAVAYPGLNMLLCRVAKQRGMAVYYMLPPQIWAWGRFRKAFLRKWVDVVISVFPFEADFYRRLGFETVLLENPLVRSLSTLRRKRRDERIGFMPGSRRSHIARNLPVVLELAGFIQRHRPDIELCLLAFDSRSAAGLRDLQNMVPVYHGDRHQMMKDCDLLVVSSGTASLEAAAMRIPQIFFHRASLLDDRILRRFVHVEEMNLANLYYGKKLVPCYITSDARLLKQELKDALTSYL
jgi:lipid-A-disaccharide synthase